MNNDRAQQHTQLVGRWFSRQPTKDGGIRQSLCERRSDGSYFIHFQVKEADGTFLESREVGEWGVSGSVYFTIFKGWMESSRFKPADRHNPYHYDAYHIVELDDARFEYVNSETGNRFVSEKVGDDFTMPMLDL